MRGRRGRAFLLALLLPVVVLPACASSGSASEEIIVGTAETADFIGDASRRLFWELPVMLLWEAPKAVFYDLPRRGIVALGDRRGRVDSEMERLAADPGTSEEIGIIDALQELTGIPLRSGPAWLGWWEENLDVPPDRWVSKFVEERVARLDSEDYFLRASAIEALRTLYGTDLDYDPKADLTAARAGKERWQRALASGELSAPRSGPF